MVFLVKFHLRVSFILFSRECGILYIYIYHVSPNVPILGGSRFQDTDFRNSETFPRFVQLRFKLIRRESYNRIKCFFLKDERIVD